MCGGVSERLKSSIQTDFTSVSRVAVAEVSNQSRTNPTLPGIDDSLGGILHSHLA